MTAREQERLLRGLDRAVETLHRVDVELMGFARSDVDEALQAIGRIKVDVEEARP